VQPARDGAALADRPTAIEALRLIWTEERISRAEIARRAELSRSTVSSVVGDLIASGLVAELGSGPSRGGRRPIELQFQYDGHGIVGIDLGATHLSVVVTNLRGEVKAFAERSVPVRREPAAALRAMRELTEAAIASWGGPKNRIVGIGIAVPSPVDPRNPDKVSEVVMPAWRGKSVAAELKERFRVPVLVDNDANLGALAEQWWGAGRGVSESVYIKVATGIGSGHIIGGKIYRGSTGTAGEIGHLAIDPHGRPCLCGLRGCLVTFVGTEALIERAKDLLRHEAESQLSGKTPTLTAIEDAALAGDPVAVQVISEAADYLGIAVAGMLNLMNPAVVSIGGSLARLGERLLEPLRRAVKSRTLVSSVAAAKIVASELGKRDVAVGAATLVLDAALQDLSYFPAISGSR
jgi:glucokinase-like ROK family protein